MRILIADDDELSLELLAHTLRKAGHTVEMATNGLEALQILQTENIRLVISDLCMPVLSGIDLCKLIRQDQDSYVYVILLTGSDDPDAVLAGMEAGADDFITKPFQTEYLKLRLRAAERILSMETRDIAIFALAKLAESRDRETGLHLERVQHYSRLIATQLSQTSHYKEQLDRELIRLIYTTSPLHDIGKVGIPDAILLKPGKLTPEEFAIMKLHVEIGTNTLDAALARYPEARFLKVARDITASHHEQWAGQGYPLGLSGEAIPLVGRIVAVADVYDALTTKRVYKDAFSHEKARQIILDGAGTQFDPEIVKAFIDCESQIIATRLRLCDTVQDNDQAPRDSWLALVPA